VSCRAGGLRLRAGALPAALAVAGSIFGLLEVPHLLDQDVVARGWYRRNPAPVLQLRQPVPAEGGLIRGFSRVVAYLLSVPLVVGGGAVWLAMSLTA
jgi:hypothetical protein